MRSPLLCRLVAVVLVGGAALPAAAQQVAAEEYVLDNGMTFLLVPRYEEPNTVTCGWVAKVGSVNERPGITGISHFFEHMMFKGTTTIGTDDPARDAEFMAAQKAVKDEINDLIWGGQYARYRRGEIDDPWDPANDTEQLRQLRARLRELMEQHRSVIEKNEFDKVYTNAGATGMNAFTSNDLTFYFINVPSNKLELWCWLESDRLHDSVFREFYAERDVVHEERRMRLESSPTGRLDEQFDAMFWQSSPYSWSVIGWPSDIHSYTREEFDAYFNIYYRPNNLVGIVVGDFQPAAMKQQIDTYFGRLSRGVTEPPPVITYEVEQIAEKRLRGECNCQPEVEVRYHTVPFNHADSFALDVMSSILNGRTGRLYKGLIEGRSIASRASGTQESWKYAGYFSYRAQVKGEATPEDLELAWYEELGRLQNEAVPDAELQKVKNQIAADSYRRLQSNNALLFQLGMYEAMDTWRYLNEAPQKLSAVTAADVLRVAKTYFEPTNRCVALYTRRASDASAGEEDELAQFPPEMRQQIEAMLTQLEIKEDPGELRMIVGMLSSQTGAMPDDVRPAMEFVLKRLEARIEELEAADDDR